MRILLAEDHRDTAEMFRLVLEHEGHEVEVAVNVTSALKKASEQSFDLLISDLGLPDGSGLDLMRELRRRRKLLPGIALSGYGQEQDVQRSREAGFFAHLIKPKDVDQLLDTIKDAPHQPLPAVI
jgi:DNA-binding response OmpR family regulator